MGKGSKQCAGCYAKATAHQGRFGMRSESRRAARRASEKRRYRRPDKREQERRLTTKQGGKCAVCRLPRPLVLDHDHKTGDPRAMLCRQCNVAVGMVGEDVAIAVALAEYVASLS